VKLEYDEPLSSFALNVSLCRYIKADKPNTPDVANPQEFLRETLKGWAPEVLELIEATGPEEIEARDLWAGTDGQCSPRQHTQSEPSCVGFSGTL